MTPNVGTTDKYIRLILAFLLLLAVWFDLIKDTTWIVVALAVAFLLALTSYLDFCPLYKLLGISTNKEGV
ncbi:MAG: DUF2892 domain-containing protein [Chlorobi bacterium]|nr:DUF2892 domain-containing protein [Chlorobiota bacterium]